MSVFGTVASLPQNALNLINGHTKSRNVANNTTGRSSLKAADSTTGTTGTTGTTTGTPSTAAQATTDIGSTFLSLLAKELQNQDPTSPMDSTQMVGQMISLNQLDQLIAINTALTPTTTATTTSGTTGSGSGSGTGTGSDPTSHMVGGPTAANSAATLAAQQALLASTSSSNSSNASAASNSFSNAASQLTADSTLNAVAARSAGSASTLNLTNFNSMFGGK